MQILLDSVRTILNDYGIFSSLVLVFLTSLSMSFGHCVGMCGGIVLVYSSLKNTTFLAHLLYNLGRLASYLCIGILFVLFGKAFALHHFWRDSVSLCVGILLIVYAICFAFFPKVLQYIEPRLQSLSTAGAIFRWLLSLHSLATFFGIGVINGFLPCGQVYFFALNTLNAQIMGLSGVLGAVAVMGAFWLGTLVPMLGVGLFGGRLRAYRKTFFVLSFLCMFALGLLNIYVGITTIAS